MSVRAKFKVVSIQDSKDYNSEQVSCRSVRLEAVYSSDPASQNFTWSKWTPSGTLTMSITNPDAFNQFEVDKEYYLDIGPVG